MLSRLNAYVSCCTLCLVWLASWLEGSIRLGQMIKTQWDFSPSLYGREFTQRHCILFFVLVFSSLCGDKLSEEEWLLVHHRWPHSQTLSLPQMNISHSLCYDSEKEDWVNSEFCYKKTLCFHMWLSFE